MQPYTRPNRTEDMEFLVSFLGAWHGRLPKIDLNATDRDSREALVDFLDEVCRRYWQMGVEGHEQYSLGTHDKLIRIKNAEITELGCLKRCERARLSNGVQPHLV